MQATMLGTSVRRATVAPRARFVQVKAELKVGDSLAAYPDYYRKMKVHKGGPMKSLSDYQTNGKPLVVFFYPKAATPGCTKEACSFRDSYAVFTDAGAEVVGISGDDEAAQKAFADAQRLPFDLLCDYANFVRKGFGIKADLFGVLPGRQTFVFDGKGKCVLSFNDQMNTDAHVQNALATIKSLKN